VDQRQGIAVFSGNMPFLGGRRIATEHGEAYAQWLTDRYDGTGDTDYVGYFFLRARELASDTACIGFITTASIADGDNRRTVLARLCDVDTVFEIYSATTGVPWTGNAQVLVSYVHLARNVPAAELVPKKLNGRDVHMINSRLRGGTEWPTPTALPENRDLALVGCFLRGEGFILDWDEGEAIPRAHPEEANVIRPFLTGSDLNETPDQRARRYVIDFGEMTLDEARNYPHALAIVEQNVRPHRERLKATGGDAGHRKYWWRFANVRRELRERAAVIPRFLATARVSKHTVFSFVPTAWTPSEQVVVFPLSTFTAFAVLQSRVHRTWVVFQASHMGEGLRYSATDCFAPFPFPMTDPNVVIAELESLGAVLYEARSVAMRSRQIGLTRLYNALLDVQDGSADLAALRDLHEKVDQAVLRAYTWDGLHVPSFAGDESSSAERDVFEDAVGERLFALNALRAKARPL
jgi:hypothetical protein